MILQNTTNAVRPESFGDPSTFFLGECYTRVVLVDAQLAIEVARV